VKILLTGGTGFIGSHFLVAALTAGLEVIALRRPGRTARLPLPREPQWQEEAWAALPEEAFAGVDALVHLAAAGVDPATANWHDCFEVNVHESLALWLRARACGVERFVICGTCFEYGNSGARYEHIPIDAPLEPTGPYHASKAAATMAALGFAVQQKAAVTILRPFHVFGPGEDEKRFWPALRAAAGAGRDFPMTPGEQVRDFVPAEEVAARFLAAARDPSITAGHPAIRHIGTGRPQTLRAFAEHWWRVWAARGELQFGALPYRADEVMRYVPEIPDHP